MDKWRPNETTSKHLDLISQALAHHVYFFGFDYSIMFKFALTKTLHKCPGFNKKNISECAYPKFGYVASSSYFWSTKKVKNNWECNEYCKYTEQCRFWSFDGEYSVFG